MVYYEKRITMEYDKKITVRLSAKEHKHLTDKAFSNRLTISKYMRKCLKKDMNDQATTSGS